jgi:VanZ family protein
MNVITLTYTLGLGSLLLFVDFGGFRHVALFVNHTFLLDKIVHFLMYGVLALLVNASLVRRSPSRAFRAIATGTTIVLVVATLEEASNALVASRTCSLADLVANYLGILCLGVLPLIAWQRTRSTKTAFCKAV